MVASVASVSRVTNSSRTCSSQRSLRSCCAGVRDGPIWTLSLISGAPLDDLLLETLDKGDHVALFSLGYLELRQCRARVTEEHVPVALADAHASMAERHVPAAVVHRPARARAEEVDQQLLLALDAVLPAMGPKAAELRIGLESGQQIIRHRRDCLIPTEALVQGLLLVAHLLLLYVPTSTMFRHPRCFQSLRPSTSSSRSGRTHRSPSPKPLPRAPEEESTGPVRPRSSDARGGPGAGASCPP